MDPLRHGGGGRTAGLALLAAALAVVLWGLATGALAPRGQRQQPLRSRLADVGADGGQSSVGPRLEPWVLNRSCPVYILDASKELAPVAGVPSCDIRDPEVWPHGLAGRGVTAMGETPQDSFQHAAQWWLTQALRNASRLLTADLDEACLVWLDMHCYNMAFMGAFDYGQPSAAAAAQAGIHRLVDHVLASPRFRRHGGRDYALVLTHPILLLGPWGSRLCSDTGLRHAYHMLAEKGEECLPRLLAEAWGGMELLPYVAVADVDLSQPAAGAHRPTFMYMQGGCHRAPKQATPGMRLRAELVAQLSKVAPDVHLACKCGGCPGGTPHAEVAQRLRSSLFCPLIQGDTASSLRLSEVLLAGCIPVFIGPPWHTMPLPYDVDWAGLGVFINITSHTPWLAANETVGGWQSQAQIDFAMMVGKQTADVAGVTVHLPSLKAAYNHLRAIPPADIREAALDRERPKLSYQPGPGGYSQLADAALANMLRYGASLAASPTAQPDAQVAGGQRASAPAAG